MILDSLESSSSSEADVIRSFLSVSLQDFLHIPCVLTDIQLPQICPAVSQQRNYVDCGCYVLGFVQAILNNMAEVNLVGNAQLVKENANQLFSWLKLPRNSIRTLRSRIVQTIQKLTKTAGADEFSVESSDSSDVEEIQQPEKESILQAKQMNDSNSSSKCVNEAHPSPEIPTSTHPSPKSLTNPPTNNGIPENVTKSQSEKEEKVEKKGLSLFDLRPNHSIPSLSISSNTSKMKVEKVKPIPGIDTHSTKPKRNQQKTQTN